MGQPAVRHSDNVAQPAELAMEEHGFDCWNPSQNHLASSSSSLILSAKPFRDGAMDDGGRLRIELAAFSSCAARRRPWSDGR